MLLQSAQSYLVLVPSMAKHKPEPKKRGRPKTTGTGQLIGVRLLPDMIAALDRERGDDSRPEAIRIILRRALKLS